MRFRKTAKAWLAVAAMLFLGCAPTEPGHQYIPALDEAGWSFVGIDTSEAWLILNGKAMKGFSLYREYEYKGKGYEGFKEARRWLLDGCLDSTKRPITDTSVKVLKIIKP
jgi:hypothetical protein